jgi:GNAT superfamily N-acetyltransferase
MAFAALLSTLPGAVLHEEPGLYWFETGVPLDLFNGVLQTRLEAAALPAAIDRVQAYFQQRRLPFHWRLGPSSQPADFGPLLEARGISHVEDEPGMAVDLFALNEALPVTSSVTIHPVTSDEQVSQWARVWGCGAPEEVIEQMGTVYTALRPSPQRSFQLYLGTLAGEPVATAALFLGAGVAEIGQVVTLPQARRQGIGAAMTLMAAQAARSQGYRIAVLTASPMGINIYRRLGFSECCTVSTYGG